MKKLLFTSVLLCAFAFLAAASANGQARSGRERVLRDTGKVTVIVVGTAAKIALETTRVVVMDVAKPLTIIVLKPIAARAAPVIANFIIKNGVKYVLPYAIRLSLL